MGVNRRQHSKRAAYLCVLVLLSSCLQHEDPRPQPPDTTLSTFTLSYGELNPPFQANLTEYTLEVPFLVTSLRVTAVASEPTTTITVDGVAVVPGVESRPLALEADTTTVEIVVTAADGVTTQAYHVTVTRQSITQFAQRAYVKASNSAGGDLFGHAVALSGDTLVVGAPYEDSSDSGVDADQTDNSASLAGAAYVFVRDGSTWTQQAYLKASNAGAGDQFGYSVALSGDVFAIGAPNEDSSAVGVNSGGQADNGAAASGAAYVFVRNGTTWTQQAYLKASNTGAGDQFGTAVAVSGETLAVGAHLERSAAAGVNGNQSDDSAAGAGAVYVFERDGVTWSQQAYLKASNAQAADNFGWSLALSADTLAVGARDEDSAATGVNGNQADDSAPLSGAVYVFVRDGDAWSQQAYIKASNTDSVDRFGWSVALAGETLVVGAPDFSSVTTFGANPSANGVDLAGTVYVFERDGTTWTQQAYVTASNAQADDRFGFDVALSGDMLVVGAIFEDSASPGINTGNQLDDSLRDAGAAYLFERVGTVWEQRAYLKASNPGRIDALGYGVDVDNDTVVLSAPGEASSATGIDGDQADDMGNLSGAVYVFR